MHLRSRRVADQEDAVRDPQVGSGADPAGGHIDANRIQPEFRERVRATDREEDLVPFDRAAIGEVDHVGIVGTGPRLDTNGLHAGTDVHPIAGEAGGHRRRTARVVLGVDRVA